MQTRREYLVSLGLAKEGRGKFSNEGKAALAKAESEGMTFSDGGAKPAPVKREDAPAPVVKFDPGASEYLLPSDFRFPLAEYIAYVYSGGKRTEVSLKECCNTCRVSLVNHSCNNPTIHDSVSVTIMERR